MNFDAKCRNRVVSVLKYLSCICETCVTDTAAAATVHRVDKRAKSAIKLQQPAVFRALFRRTCPFHLTRFSPKSRWKVLVDFSLQVKNSLFYLKYNFSKENRLAKNINDYRRKTG